MIMLDKLENLYSESLDALKTAEATAVLDTWYKETLGRKGSIYLMTRQVGQLSPEERPVFGKRINAVKQELEAAYQARLSELKAVEMESQIASSAIDVTLPGRPLPKGRLHIITQTMREIYRIFGDMGFQIYRSPDVETDAYNFELLNFPPHHPAREMQDTFYTEDSDVILRTHTSAGQIRAMLEYNPEPVRVILPGMCYRNEQITTRSSIQFTQVEGLAVGTNITFADLKGTLTEFARRMFGANRQSRFRASYFPFTEPSAEMDVTCFICEGKGCQVCKQTGWLEILGCGMVHPTVLKNGGYDPTVYTGFAFGMGPERITMLKYGINDIRQFWNNDLRFLQQF
ncbi:MAG: phenylalanine--tRNA ligase subunit alpha [Chloroflexi bacterium]|nr:phenylalanine--tRNA ligase subunit alpha [Chloroflexota bacterium]